MRIQPVKREEMSERQLQILTEMERGPRGGVGSLMMVWLHCPELTDNVQKVGAYFRQGTSLPQHIMEMIVLIVARHWRCDMEWYFHAPLALKKGLDPTVMESIRQGRRPDFRNEAEAAAYDFTKSMLDNRDASDEVVERVRVTLGEKGFVDISILIGHYVHGAIVINGARLPIPEGAKSPFADV